MTQTAGPASLVLSASIARRYYLDGRSKLEIAEEFGLSRFKVARLIEAARSSGLVRIEIGHKGRIDVDLSARVQARFGLAHAVVVDTTEDTDESAAQAPRAGRGRAARRAGRTGRRARRGVVPLGRRDGAGTPPAGRRPGRPAHRRHHHARRRRRGSIDIVRDVARAAGGPAYVFYAPFTLPDAATARDAAQPARGRPGPRPAADGDQGRGGHRCLGAGPVDPVRHGAASTSAGSCGGSASARRSPVSSCPPKERPCGRS